MKLMPMKPFHKTLIETDTSVFFSLPINRDQSKPLKAGLIMGVEWVSSVEGRKKCSG